MTVASPALNKSSLVFFLISSFIQSAFYWGLSAYVSKVFGLKVLGEFSYALAILGPLSILSGLQLKSYLLTQKKSDIKSQSKWLRLVFPFLIFSFATGVMALIEPWLLPIFLPLLFLKWGELWSDLAYGLWQVDSGLSRVNVAMILRYALCLPLLIFLRNEEVSIILGAIAVVSVLMALLDYFKSGLKDVPLLKKGSCETFKVTMGLSLSALLTSLLVNIPRYQLKEFHSLETVGMFSLLFYYYVIPSMVINFSCQGLLGHISQFTRSKKTVFILFSFITFLSILYGTTLYLVGEPLTLALYGHSPTFNLSLSGFIALAFCLGGISSLLHYILMGRNIYNIQLATNIFSSLTTGILGFILIPKFGLNGAFISFLSGLLVQSTVYGVTYTKLKP